METVNQLIIPKLIVGLGNPEAKYDKTRHNIGFQAVDTIARLWQTSWQENRRFQGTLAEANLPGKGKIRLLKPLTYMNRSGESVRAVSDWYKIPPESILVVYDDLDLPVGRLRIRLSGSSGGHNGIKSIISHLNVEKFPRLRVGIGKTKPNEETIGHVLGKFAPDEVPVIGEALKLSVEAIEHSLTQGLEKTMSLYNSRTVATNS